MSVDEFVDWSPDAPTVVDSNSHSVTLTWSSDPYTFLQDQLVSIVQRKEKIPPWIIVYSGGKTLKVIDNLAPTQPHKFRLRFALKRKTTKDLSIYSNKDHLQCHDLKIRGKSEILQSRWSEEVWVNTTSDGSSTASLCMAIRCGYGKQVQQMLDERPALLSAINGATGVTPLATAVIKGDTNMVVLLLSRGADLEQHTNVERTPLHLAVLSGHCSIADLLLEHGANNEAQDINKLRVEHLAVDSGDLETLKFVLDRGDINVMDSNGWTPLFRAVCQGAKTEIIAELVRRGSNVEITDRAGLTLISAAKLLTDRHGRRRNSVLQLVDSKFHHEKAVASFTRLSKKISSVHALRVNK